MMERPTRIMKLGKQLRTYKKMSWKLRFWNEILCSFFFNYYLEINHLANDQSIQLN